MTFSSIILLLLAIEPGKAQAHAENPVFQAVLSEGLSVDGRKVVLPSPRFRDGMTGQEEAAELKAIAGSERAVADLLRDSISASMVLKTGDEPSPGKILVRKADVFFAIKGDLDELKPDDASKQATTAKPVDVANMSFSSHVLGEAEVSGRKLNEGAAKSNETQWHVHFTSKLLDRIHVEATTHVMASRSADSWVIASRTDPRFAEDKEFPNRWWPYKLQGAKEVPGKAEGYEGGISYLKINKLATKPGMLLVEAHFAFAEPKAWFDGAPILRSKISVIAQDQIRTLRREVAKAREKSAAAGSR